MTPIEYTVTHRGSTRRVKITQPSGAPNVFHLYIDDRYQGQIMKVDGQWRSALHRDPQLTAAQLQAIAMRIEDQLARDVSNS